MSERFPIATHHKKRLYAPEKRMYQLWTPRFNQGVGTLYLIPIEMPMGPLPNMSPISKMGTTLSSTTRVLEIYILYPGYPTINSISNHFVLGTICVSYSFDSSEI